MKPVIALLIPTNKPQEFKEKFLTCLPMFDKIKHLILLCFNFQPPWTDNLIKEQVINIKSKGFNVNYCINDYKWVPETFSFVTMRNDAAHLVPKDIPFYADYDDDICIEDIEYGAKIWCHALSFLLTNSQYGSLRIDKVYEHALGGAFHKNSIYTMLSRNNRTGLGLIYRNIYGGNVLPDEQLKLLGCREDHLQIMQRVKDGYLHAFLRAPFGYHTDVKAVKSRFTYGLDALAKTPTSITYYLDKIFPEINYEPYGKDFQTWLDYETKLDMTLSVSVLVEQLEAKVAAIV